MTEMGVDADGNSTWQHTNVWDGGKLLATYDLNGVHFYLDDPLGTRQRPDRDAWGVTEQTCQSLPYGDGETCAPTPRAATRRDWLVCNNSAPCMTNA